MPANETPTARSSGCKCGACSDARHHLLFCQQFDISPNKLSRALVDFERPPLAELIAARSLSVFADAWKTAAGDWERISTAVLASSVAEAALGEVSSVWRMLGQPAMVVRELPQRVYGGLEAALYTCHPFQFRLDPNRSAPWYRALLSASGSRLFNTWVHLDSGQVEVESGVLLGHYVE